MKTVRIYFTACVLFHLQPGVHVSTDTSTASWHQTATPDVLTSPSPDLVPRCEEMAELFSCQNKCEKRTQWDETDSLKRFELHCHCDQACLKYHDCCADIHTLLSTIKSSTSRNKKCKLHLHQDINFGSRGSKCFHDIKLCSGLERQRSAFEMFGRNKCHGSQFFLGEHLRRHSSGIQTYTRTPL